MKPSQQKTLLELLPEIAAECFPDGAPADLSDEDFLTVFARWHRDHTADARVESLIAGEERQEP
jgi:hypothetical protein